MAMRFRAAEPADLNTIERLLVDAGLPTPGVAEHLESFVVAEEIAAPGEQPAGDVVGVGGLELYGRVALLRSVVVARAARGRGIASAICTWLEREAARRGCGHMFLLTETAESFFEKRGYVVVARTDAPAEIVATEEFTTLCPDSAVLMAREL